MKKIVEHTYGTSAYMKIGFSNGETEEINVFWRDDGETYRTSADNNPDKRAAIIEAFNLLY